MVKNVSIRSKRRKNTRRQLNTKRRKSLSYN